MSSIHKYWEKADDFFSYLLPLILMLLLVYLYITFANTDFLSGYKVLMEAAILGYFSFELVIKLVLSDSMKEFLSNNWLKIILILPFLRVFRIFGVFGNTLRYLRVIPYMQKLAKIPKLLKGTKFFVLLLSYKLSIIKEKEIVEKEKKKLQSKERKAKREVIEE